MSRAPAAAMLGALSGVLLTVAAGSWHTVRAEMQLAQAGLEGLVLCCFPSNEAARSNTARAQQMAELPGGRRQLNLQELKPRP